MRKITFLAIFIMAILFLGLQTSSQAQLLFEENFDYPVGDLLTVHGWVSHSGTSNFIATTAATITYPSYLSSGIGNEVTLLATGEDVHQTFTAQATGSVYASFIVNITTAVQDTGDYFFHLGQTVLGSAFRGRVFAKKDVNGNLAFGLRFASQTATPTAYTPYSYSLNTTYLLVLKYTFVEGTSNDVVSLFVNPILGAPEPSPTVIASDVNSDLTDVGTVSLRQGSSILAPTLKFDGIRIGLTWDDVAGTGSVVTPTVQASNLSFSNVLQNQMDVAWTNGDGAKRIAVINLTNSFTDPDDGSDPIANPVYGGSGEQVVYNDNGNSMNVTGLTGGTTYWFRVYEYNGSGATTKFLVAEATLNPNSQTTSTAAFAPIIINPTYAGVTNSSAMLGGDISSDGGSAILERGSVWNTVPGVTIADNKLAEGGTDIGVFSHLRSGLAPKTQVFFKAFATNAIGTSLTDELSFFTLANEPTSHVEGFAAIGSGITSIDLSWTTAVSDADGYLILQKVGGIAPTGIPADATGYAVGSTLGDGTVAALVAPGSSLAVAISGLSPSTQYSFTIIPFAWDGANFQTYNYYTDPTIPSATALTQTPPATIYTWIGADNESWTTPANWDPARSVPASNDMLQFNDGTTKTITNVPTEMIQKLVLSNNSIINLQSSAPNTLNIGGGDGTDMDIPAGCALNLNAVNAITIHISTGATASISGSMTFSSTENTAHRLTGGDDPGAITFNSGATFTAGLFFSGNAFGTTALGSVIFSNGSTYIHQAGSNPFGASQPNSVVVFQTGSLYKFISTGGTPSFSGRTYANFEMDAPGVTIAPTGGGPVSIDDLTITSGTLNFNTTGTPGHSIKGNILVATDGTLSFSPATPGTVILNGSAAQYINGSGTITSSTNSTLEIANSAGVTVNRTIVMNGNLQLTNGLVKLGTANLLLGSASAILGTPSSTAMIVATTGGQLQKAFAAAGSFTYPVGDDSGIAEYTPITLNFTNGVFATENYAGVNLSNSKYPYDPNTLNYLNRYWSVWQSGITEFTCNAAFQYVPDDINGSEDQIFCIQVDPTPYTSYDPANTILHQLTANGLTNFGTYTGTQLLSPTVSTNTASEIGDSYATLNGTVNANNLNTTVSFEYGLTNAYGFVAAGVPPTITGNIATNFSAAITSLDLNTTYHFRAVGSSVGGTSYGEDLTFLTGCPVPSAAGTVTGPATVCQNEFGYIYSVDVIPGATLYVWTLPFGASIASGAGTNQITVDFGSNAISGNISVLGNNGCGNGPSSPDYAVTVNPLPASAGTITGPSFVCAGATGMNFQVPVIADATSYTWTVPAGATITSGSNTNSIIVTFGNEPGSGSITVYGTNACGSGTVSPDFIIGVNALPTPTISGPSSVCVNSTNNVYMTQSGMNNYIWSVSAGGIITAGLGTNTISVTWNTDGANAVMVNYTNSNNCSAAAPASYNVTVNAIPEAPVVTAAGAVLTSSAALGNQWYNEVTGIIAGETGQTYTAVVTGSYYTIVTVNDCVSPESNHVYIIIDGLPELENSNFSVYPMPNDGRFTVSISSLVQEDFTIVVYNQLGTKIYELGDVRVNGTFEKQIDLRPIASGIYSVVFLNSEHKVVKKVLVNK